ncbi:hypothetical protein D3C86_631130 [compost metagenome]
MQTVGLRRVIGGQFEQGIEYDVDPRLGRFIGFEKLVVAAEQEATHAGFQVDGQLDRLIGIIDHPVCVLDPLDRRQQISNQRHEKNRTDHADTQRQADVAAQEFTESLLINRRRGGHNQALLNG